MFYVIYGTNREAVAKKKAEIIADHSEAELVAFDTDAWSSSVREEYTGGRGLFSDTFVVTAHNVLSNKELRDDVVKNLEDFSGSENTFIFIEDELKKNVAKKLKKHAEEVCVLGEDKKGRDKRIFALTDAIGKRDRKAAWQAFQRVSADQAPEQIFPMIFWQFKNMALAQQTSSAKEAGMSAYPYKKATQFAGNFSPKDIKQISARLTKIYHEAHMGKYDMSAELERFLLEL